MVRCLDRRHGFGSKVLSGTVIISLLSSSMTPAFAAGVDSVNPSESFNFAERASPQTEASRNSGNGAALVKDKAPVSTSGAFSYSIPIDLPPGRLNLTPNISLSYTSGAFRSDGPIGAGWSFSRPAIVRSTRYGFPPVTTLADLFKNKSGHPLFSSPGIRDSIRDRFRPIDVPSSESANDSNVPALDSVVQPALGDLLRPAVDAVLDRTPIYDNNKTVFESPLGELVPTDDGPSSASGRLYRLARDTHPVRYEYIPYGHPDAKPSEYWIEHDPSGMKRYYGAYDKRTGAIANELGTHAWLLLEEVDPSGNAISYTYYHGNPKDRKATDPQEDPILATVAWGANKTAGIPQHVYRLETSISPQQGSVDMLHGHVVVNAKVDSISVYGPDDQGISDTLYWRYELQYKQSQDTDRLLLNKVIRLARDFQGAMQRQTHAWDLDYSGNKGKIEWASTPASLAGLKGAYQNEYANRELPSIFTGSYDNQEIFANPQGHASATKFMDYDGDGRTDSIYHPAGLITPEAWIHPAESFLRSNDGFVPLGSPLPLRMELEQKKHTELADLDGDLDQDAFLLPSTNWVPLDPHIDPDGYAGGVCIRAAKTCCTNGLSCDPNRMPRETCPGGRCPDRIPLRDDIIYPPDRVRDMGRSSFEHVWRDGKAGSADTAKAGGAGGAFCAWAPQACGATFYGGVIEELCDVPDGSCANQKYAAFCKERCEASQGIRSELAGHAFNILVGRNTNGRIEGPTDLFSLQKWPELAVNLVGRRAVTNPNTREVTFYPVTQAEFYAPIVDVNADGKADIALLKSLLFTGQGAAAFSPRIGFLPRVYLNRDFVFPLDQDESEAQSFTKSAITVLRNGLPDGCFPYSGEADGKGCTADLPYDPKENFNSFLSDLNGDGLPDLVVAQPPIKSPPERYCVPGHQVYLNRGYRWETPDDAWQALGYSSNNRAELDNSQIGAHPFLLLRNYTPRAINKPQGIGVCSMQESAFNLHPLPSNILPMGSMAQTDINGDGRLDIVFAITPVESTNDEEWSRAYYEVYINTGRGFRIHPLDSSIKFPVSTWGVNYYDPDLSPMSEKRGLFRLMVECRSQIDIRDTPQMRAWCGRGDLGRFVDVDNDGLDDLVTPGTCTPVVPKDLINETRARNRKCAPARWHRNLGKVPDILTSIDTQAGERLEVDYVSASSQQAQDVVDSRFTPHGLMVAKEIRRRVRPDFPDDKEVTRLRYTNYVKNPVATSPIGFETIHELVYSSNNLTQPLVGRTYTYDVRPSVEGIEVAFPLQGMLVRAQSKSSHRLDAMGVIHTDDTVDSTQTREYELTVTGAAARIRLKRAIMTECLGRGGSSSCVSAGEEVQERDAYGYPTKTISGNFDGRQFTADIEHLTQTLVYQHNENAWWLGRTTDEEIRGWSRDLAGNARPNSVLSHRAFSYDGLGRLTSETRLAIGAAGCADVEASDTTRYEYKTSGIPSFAERNGRGGVTTTYDAFDLCEASKTVVAGGKTLTVSSKCDYRSGQARLTVDLNGHQSSSVFDSLGRVLQQRGPSGETLLERLYEDVFPRSITSTVYTDNLGKAFFYTKEFLDGAGQEIASLRWTSSKDVVRTSFHRTDAHGRRLVSYLPQGIVGEIDPISATPDHLAPASDAPRAQMGYDGFGRLINTKSPDGLLSWTSYAPRSTLETNPRGFHVDRRLDARGNVLSVRKLAADGVSVQAAYQYTWDGLGRLLSIVDPDGSVREMDRDGAGRIHRMTQPHNAGTSAGVFQVCYSPSDKPRQVRTPAGRTLALEYDELDRLTYTLSTSAVPGETTAQTFASYDQATGNSLGRLSSLGDDSGTTSFGYDVYGFHRIVQYAPTEEIRLSEGGANLEAVYSAEYLYSPRGKLINADLSTYSSEGDHLFWLARYHYDLDVYGRIKELSSRYNGESKSLVSVQKYDARDRVRSALLGNGTTATWDYDEVRDLLSGVSYGFNDGTSFLNMTYGYDTNRNIVGEQVARILDGATLRTSASSVYGYDGMDRLTSWTQQGNGRGGARAEAYVYSPGGNLKTAANDVYVYGLPSASQAATQITNGPRTRSLTYDADGWLQKETQTESSVSTENFERALSYDASGCLRQVISETETTTNVCGQGGRRVLRKTVDKKTGATKRVIDFAGIAEIRPDEDKGVFLVRASISSSTVLEDAHSLADGHRLVARSGYLHKDFRGSILAKTSFEPGQKPRIQEGADYGVWGETIAVPGVTAPAHAFVDHEPDPGLGYYHFGARVYDPSLRRWLSPDPLILALPEVDTLQGQQLNLYAYAANSPVTYVDPTGTIAVADDIVLIGVTAAFGASILMSAITGNAAYRERGGKALSEASDVAKDKLQVLAKVAAEGAKAAVNAAGRAFANGGGSPGPHCPQCKVAEIKREDRQQSKDAPAKNGETQATKEGKAAHKSYKTALGDQYNTEVTLPSGKRADAVHKTQPEVRELKPDNPRAIRMGQKQVEGYARELESLDPQERTWTGVVDTYNTQKKP